MKEEQRFLRYVMPGLVFLTETILFLYILLPDWTVQQLEVVQSDQALGVVFATLLASGGVGFVFSILHHWVHWNCTSAFWESSTYESGRSSTDSWWNWLRRWSHALLYWIFSTQLWDRFHSKWKALAVDHSECINRLRDNDVIALIDTGTRSEIPKRTRVGREVAWTIMTSLWHERLSASPQIGSAEPRARQLVDLVHTTGTALVASTVASIAAIVIAGHVADRSFERDPVIRFIVANGVGLSLLWVHYRGCVRVCRLAQGFIEEVLHDALLAEMRQTEKTQSTEKEAPGELLRDEARPIETVVVQQGSVTLSGA